MYGLVPNSPPTTFLDASGKPTGFFVELFSRILDELNIPYEFQVGTFAELYPRMISGEIDFFTTLVKRPDREELFYFSDKSVFAGWSQLFIARGASIDTVLTLQHKRIAVVAEDQNGANFRTYIQSLAIPCEIVEYRDFDAMVEAVASGEAFGGVQSNWYVSADRRIQPTALVFAPFQSYPVLSRSSPFKAEFDAVVERYSSLAADPDSCYYELQAKWLGREQTERAVLPPWLLAALSAFASAALIFGAATKVLTRRLRDANRGLEEQVRERTARLVKSEKLAALGRLVANVAHELNTPLQVMRAVSGPLSTMVSEVDCGAEEELSEGERALLGKIRSARPPQDGTAAARKALLTALSSLGEEPEEQTVELLLDLGVLDPDRDTWAAFRALRPELARRFRAYAARRDLFAASEAAVDQMDSVIRDLRAYVGRDRPGERSTVSLASQIDGALTLFADKLTGDIRMVAEYSDLPEYRCVDERLRQVWMILVSNALDAMDGSGTLRIRGAEENGWILVAVEDSGCGVPKNLGERIFEPFFTTKTEGTAIGLGLSSARSFVRELGGSITYLSRPGSTVFTVRLPASGAEVRGA